MYVRPGRSRAYVILPSSTNNRALGKFIGTREQFRERKSSRARSFRYCHHLNEPRILAIQLPSILPPPLGELSRKDRVLNDFRTTFSYTYDHRP